MRHAVIGHALVKPKGFRRIMGTTDRGPYCILYRMEHLTSRHEVRTRERYFHAASLTDQQPTSARQPDPNDSVLPDLPEPTGVSSPAVHTPSLLISFVGPISASAKLAGSTSLSFWRLISRLTELEAVQ
jgi:hypothetical protein